MAEFPAPGSDSRWLRWTAVVVFVALFVFGLLLFSWPELAKELDERSAGGSVPADAVVTVTESKRSVEGSSSGDSDSTTRARSRSANNEAISNARARKGAGTSAKTSSTARQDQSQTTTEVQTTTSQTTEPGRETNFVAQAFAVPAILVLLRVALITLIAFLVSGLVYRVGRRQFGIKVGAIELPVVDLVTPAKATDAKARVIDGIPLLREIFEARGEPRIDNTLPDMRVRVQLTETLTKEQPFPVSLLAEDAALALGSFRTELEQRLRRLSRDASAQSASSIDQILQQLVEEGLFEASASEGFRELFRMAERALHGTRIDPAMAAWVKDEGVPLLLSLDLMLPS
jgi:hypothetical protein